MTTEDHELHLGFGATAVEAATVEQRIIQDTHHTEGTGHDMAAPDADTLTQQLRAVRREVRAVRSAMEQLQQSSPDGIAEEGEMREAPMSLAQGELQHAVMGERLAGLQWQATELENALRASGSAPEVPEEAFITDQRPKKRRKSKGAIKELEEADLFDVADGTAPRDRSVSLVETERDRLIRLGVLTPFDRLGGYERRVERGAHPPQQNARPRCVTAEDADAAIAMVGEKYKQIRDSKHTSKLLEPSELPRPERSARKVDESFWRAAASKHDAPPKHKRTSTLPRAKPLRRAHRSRGDEAEHTEGDDEDASTEGENVSTASDASVDGDEEDDIAEDEVLLDASGKYDDAEEKIYLQRHRAYLRQRRVKLRRQQSVADGNDTSNIAGGLSGEERSHDQVDEEDVVFEGGYKVPGDLYAKLFEYQRTGVKWMWELHTQRAGGIIGDEMGLGKTIQVIAFLAGLHHSGMFRPTLIVCPATVLQQWLRELRAWYPPFRVAILHDSLGGHVKGTSRSTVIRNIAASAAGIVLTTYDQLRVHRSELLPVRWGYAILDEGHKIRNPDAEITLVTKQLATVHRMIMSGSPIQNRLVELWSLFDFVFPGKLGTLPVFQTQFALPIAIGGYANASPLQVSAAYKCAVVLRDLIAPYLLRRRKADVATALPKKTERVLFCTLTQEQRELYKAYLASKELSDIMAGNRAALAGIDVLRKICNHPDLLERGKWNAASEYGHVDRSGKLQVLQKLLSHWHEQGHKVLVFTQTQQMLDIIEKLVHGWRYHRMDGSTSISTRARLIDDFNTNPDIFVFLLTTRVGGLGVNLTGANRCVIFDPDWNPSTDIQARERAWRIGQSREVAIYRLITSGTIEEKVYHRQVYKQFLTEKVLKDPRQKRFFKARDLGDLFTLGDEYADGTETAEIFATLDTEIRADDLEAQHAELAGVGLSIAPVGSPSDRDDYSSDEVKANDTNIGTTNGIGTQTNGTSSDAQILRDLFDGGGGVHAALDHDKIEGAHNPAHRIAQREATKIAERAALALRRSRLAVQQTPVNHPTWTGRSGEAGAQGAPRFGSTVNSRLQLNSGGIARNRFGGVQGGDGGVLRSSQLLARMRERQAAVTDSTTTNVQVAQAQTLAERVAAFIQQRGGAAASADVATAFQREIGPGDLALFRGILKQVAKLERGAGGSKKWVLRPEFAAA